MKNLSRTIATLVAGLLACGSCLSALAAVTASLDRDSIALGETVRLQVQSDGSADGQPDIGPLRQDFDVLGSSLQIINGHSSSQTQVNLILAPKHAGTIRIPPLQWGGEQSPPLELTVSGNGSGQGGSSDNQGAGGAVGSSAVFLTATPDRGQAYVQAPVVLTVRLHAAVPINQASLDLPGNSDVLIKQIGKDTQSSELRNGRTYQVVERKYLLIPQRSGRISVPGPVLDAQVQDPGSSGIPDLDALLRNALGQNPLGAQLGMSRPLHLAANPVVLNILPRPAAASSGNWLPAKKLTLQQSWRPEQGAIHAGEPLTRHLHLAAVGLTGAQLPDLGSLMPVPDGIKIYPDQAKVADNTQGQTIEGSRDQDIALIASKPGHYELPALRLSWWDTGAKVERVAELPARTLDILPAVGAAAPAATPVAPSAASPAMPAASAPSSAGAASPVTVRDPSVRGQVLRWKRVSAALALLWLATLAGWAATWRYSRRHTGKVAAMPEAAAPATTPAPQAVGRNRFGKRSAGALLAAVQQACRDNDAQLARQRLLEWAAGAWPDAPPRGLNAIAQRLADPLCTDALQQLDRACYTGTAWQGERLASALAAAPKEAAPEKAGTVIPELYL